MSNYYNEDSLKIKANLAFGISIINRRIANYKNFNIKYNWRCNGRYIKSNRKCQISRLAVF